MADDITNLITNLTDSAIDRALAQVESDRTRVMRRTRRLIALRCLRARMLALVPLQPEDDLEARDVSARRLRAIGQLDRLIEQVR